MRASLRHLFENPIRAFALLAVAATSGFLCYVVYWLIEILSSPGWCAQVLQAEKITPGNTFAGLVACIDIAKMQVASLSQALMISVGTLALCLGVLVVIVIAGARLAGKLFGQDIDISRQDPVAKAADRMVGAAVDEAQEIKGGE